MEEPREGSVVIDAMGVQWFRDDGPYGGPGKANWVRLDMDADPESWVKISGNYGPVRILKTEALG